MVDNYTLEQQELLYKELNKKLKDYFKGYNIKILSTEIYFDLGVNGHLAYAVCTEINSNKENIRTAMCNLVADGSTIDEMIYPKIPDDVNKVVENTL